MGQVSMCNVKKVPYSDRPTKNYHPKSGVLLSAKKVFIIFQIIVLVLV